LEEYLAGPGAQERNDEVPQTKCRSQCQNGLMSGECREKQPSPCVAAKLYCEATYQICLPSRTSLDAPYDVMSALSLFPQTTQVDAPFIHQMKSNGNLMTQLGFLPHLFADYQRVHILSIHSVRIGAET
jgi:hypothetical protein